MRRPEGVADQLRGAELHTLVDVRGREHMAEQLVERSRVTGRRALGDAAAPAAHGGAGSSDRPYDSAAPVASPASSAARPASNAAWERRAASDDCVTLAS